MFTTSRRRHHELRTRSFRSRRPRNACSLEPLEPRIVLSTPYVVNTFADIATGSGDSGSLRYVLGLANSDPNGSSITFSSLFDTPRTIALDSTLGPLNLSESVGTETIQGPAGGVTISGTNTFQIFNVASGVDASLSDLTISRGRSAQGGGLYNAGSLQLTDCTLSANVATSDGGGLFNGPGSTLTITGSSLTGNSAPSAGGGGLFNAGTADIEDSTLSSNWAIYGGGTTNVGTLTVGGCTFSSNSTYGTDGGGAIFNYNSTASMTVMATINDSTFVSNHAAFGGAIYQYSVTSNPAGEVTATNSTFASNSASSRGGAIGNSSTGHVTLVNCTLAGNNANYGGALSLDSGGTTTLVNTIVSGNTAGLAGPDAFGTVVSQGYNLVGKTDGSTGWVASDQTGTIASPLDPMLALLGNYGGPTQTMALLPGSPAVGKGTVVSGITADQRGMPIGPVPDVGAVQVSLVVESAAGTIDTSPTTMTLPGAVSLANQYSDAQITFDPSVFTPGTTIPLAGALDLTNTTGITTITGLGAADVIVSGGDARQVFSIASGVTATLSGLAISGGLAASGAGVHNLGKISLANCILSGNSALNGGGLYNEGTAASASLTDCTVSGNSAGTSSSGAYEGGGLLNYQGTLTLLGCTVTGNTALLGAGVLNSQGSTTLTDCQVTSNSAGELGGGIASSGETTITNSTVSGNSALRGAGIYNDYHATTVTGTTISGNSAGEKGGGILSYGGTTDLTNCTLTGNMAATSLGNANASGGGIFNSSTLTITGGTISSNSAVTLGDSSKAEGGGIFNAANGVLTFTGGTTMALNEATASGASADAFGGGILNSGQFKLYGVNTIGHNSADVAIPDSSRACGGGLYNNGTAKLDAGSTVEDNVATTEGGGLYNRNGTLNVTGCTVSGNTAQVAGGVDNNNGGTMTIAGGSVSGNDATQMIGGILNLSGPLTITDCTISGNSAGTGTGIGGLLNYAGTVSLTGCTISGNSGTAIADMGHLTISGGTINGSTTGVMFLLQSGQAGHGSIDGVNFSGTTANITDVTIGAGAGTVTLGAATPNTFAAATTYIDNQSSLPIDASNNDFSGYFGGALAKDASPTTDLADFYAVEDKVSDNLDNPAFGYVNLNTGNVFVTQQSETTTPGAIQRGINAALSGGTV